MGDCIMHMCLVGTETEVIAANAQIESNCGIPCEGTDNWDIPTQAFEQDFWFITMPPLEGWNNYLQEQMMQGVVDVLQMEFEPNWRPSAELEEEKP